MFPKLHGLIQLGFPMYPKHIGLDANGFTNVPQYTLAKRGRHYASSFSFAGDGGMDITENGVYFLKKGLYDVIRKVGGICQDRKERPVVAIVPSVEDNKIYWAIPMGDLSHRTTEQLERLQGYLNSPDKMLRSCFYHIGNTDKKSLFFISDVLPITAEYVERAYIAHNNPLIIKNKKLIAELNRKVTRILAFEKDYLRTKGKPYFRQNIYGIYNELKQLG